MRIVFVTGGQVMIKSRYWRLQHFYSLITHNHQGLAITLASSLTLPIIVIVHKTVDKHLQPAHVSSKLWSPAAACAALQCQGISYRHNHPLSQDVSLSSDLSVTSSRICVTGISHTFLLHVAIRHPAIISVVKPFPASDARLMHQINVNRETLRWAPVNRLELLRPF